jgi:hypothetical protein
MISIVGFAPWRRVLSAAVLAWLTIGAPAQAADDIAWRNVADTVFRRPAADLALYEAKRAGRNTWRWSSPILAAAQPQAGKAE